MNDDDFGQYGERELFIMAMVTAIVILLIVGVPIILIFTL